MHDHDHDQLQRFVAAQQPIYSTVLSELHAGRKRSHWMWFIFPQIAGLGHSEMARKFSIASLEEAQAYLQHPTLGKRLQECSQLVADTDRKTANDIFGHPDDLKFHSSMTLFAESAGVGSVFQTCLDKYFGGQNDARTIEILGR